MCPVSRQDTFTDCEVNPSHSWSDQHTWINIIDATRRMLTEVTMATAIEASVYGPVLNSGLPAAGNFVRGWWWNGTN